MASDINNSNGKPKVMGFLEWLKGILIETRVTITRNGTAQLYLPKKVVLNTGLRQNAVGNVYVFAFPELISTLSDPEKKKLFEDKALVIFTFDLKYFDTRKFNEPEIGEFD